MRPLLVAAVVLGFAFARPATSEIMAKEGWQVHPTPHGYQVLIERLDRAAEEHQLAVVTRASATVGAKKALAQTIPGNMVVGLYHPRFAVRMLEASVQSGIEAPIRVYITENPGGTATLSYKTPTHVFAPYLEEGGAELRALAEELDQLFAAVAAQAAGQ